MMQDFKTVKLLEFFKVICSFACDFVAFLVVFVQLSIV